MRDRTKVVLALLVTVLVLLAATAHAQAAGIKKFPGETTTVAWTNPSTDDSKVTGWRVKSAATSAGPYSVVTSVANTARQAVFPAAFSTNSVMVFYQVVAYWTAGGVTVESDPVPAAGLEVDMNVVMPTGPSVR